MEKIEAAVLISVFFVVIGCFSTPIIIYATDTVVEDTRIINTTFAATTNNCVNQPVSHVRYIHTP